MALKDPVLPWTSDPERRFMVMDDAGIVYPHDSVPVVDHFMPKHEAESYAAHLADVHRNKAFYVMQIQATQCYRVQETTHVTNFHYYCHEGGHVPGGEVWKLEDPNE